MSPRIATHLVITLAAYLAAFLLYMSYASPRFRHWIPAHLFHHRYDEDDLDEESLFNPVIFTRWLIIPTFISLWCLFYPMAQADLGRNSGFTSVFDAIFRSGQTFSMDSSIQNVWDMADDIQEVYTLWDRGWIAVILTIAPFLTLISAVTLFRLPKFWFTMLVSRRKICIFSDLNDRAKMYAEALQREPVPQGRRRRGKARKPYIVFCADGSVDSVDTSNIAGQNLVLKQEICDIYLTRKARRRASFYLVTNDDHVTIEQAGKLQKKYGKYASRIYCVSSGSLNEHAVDQLNRTAALNARANPEDTAAGMISFQNGVMASRSEDLAELIQTSYIEIISEPTRVIYHMLYQREEGSALIDRSFLTDVLHIRDSAAPEKTIRILILGAGVIGEELARTMMWYCQLPRVGVRVSIASQESEKEIRGRVFRRNMEFDRLLDGNGPLSALRGRVSLNVLAERDLLSEDLEEILRASQQGSGDDQAYHFVFIATGDDNQNYRLALRIRRYYLRHPNAWGCPKIEAVIRNMTLNRIIGKSDYIPLKGGAPGTDYAFMAGPQGYNQECRVYLAGSMRDTVYPLNGLVYDSLRYHSFYSGNQRDLCGENVEIPVDHYRTFYSSSESDERSNWAVALHGILKYRWYQAMSGTEGRESALAAAEQVRWCIFKLIEGDAPVPEDRLAKYMEKQSKGRDTDPIRGFHSALRSWEDLTEKAKGASSPIADKMKSYQTSTVGAALFAVQLEKSRDLRKETAP